MAEDLVQEAFVRLVGKLRRLREQDAFGAYLRRTIVNLATSHFRRRRAERAYLERLAGTPAAETNPNEELDETMHQALLRLPERQRAAMILRYYEDLSDVSHYGGVHRRSRRRRHHQVDMPVACGPPSLALHPESMRGSRTAPRIDLPEGVACCGGIVSVQAGELPYHQRFFPGTTAWRIAYRRRDAAEGVNGALKGTFVNIGQKFFKAFGLVKIKLLLAFTLAAYNLETIRSLLARRVVQESEAQKPCSRKKRRKGTWRDVVAIRPETGPDPPPA